MGVASEMVPCIPKHLPDHQLVEAMHVATAVNPANGLALQAVAAMAVGVPLGPAQVAVLTQKYWGPKPRKLGVRFLEKTPADLKKRILGHANRWDCAITFAETSGTGDVRLTREQAGYWSFLGTDILMIPAGQPTLCLQQFTMQTPESEFRRVVPHEFGHCLDGDTLIDCPRDLEKYPQGIPIRELVGRQPWVYAWKGDRIVIRRASRVWLSRRNVPTVRVHLRTGAGRKDRVFLPPLELIGTPDHPVLLADGKTWRNLGDLCPGDRLCSLYRQKNSKRSRINWTGSERIREHVFVCEQMYGRRPPECHAHHKNERMLDQSPDNLEWKDRVVHHRDHSIGRRDTEETRARRVAANIGRRHTDASRAKMADAARSRPPASAETRAKISALFKGITQSPELVEKRMAGVRAFHAAKKAAASNHVVVAVESAGPRDVYDMTVPDADSFVANGVVVHNSLGFPHEHQRKAIVDLLDPEAVYRIFGPMTGWSREMIHQQVLTPIDERLMKGSKASKASIMAYWFDGRMTRDHQPIPGGTDLTADDLAVADVLYPTATSKPPRTPKRMQPGG